MKTDYKNKPRNYRVCERKDPWVSHQGTCLGSAQTRQRPNRVYARNAPWVSDQGTCLWSAQTVHGDEGSTGVGRKRFRSLWSGQETCLWNVRFDQAKAYVCGTCLKCWGKLEDWQRAWTTTSKTHDIKRFSRPHQKCRDHHIKNALTTTFQMHHIERFSHPLDLITIFMTRRSEASSPSLYE